METSLVVANGQEKSLTASPLKYSPDQIALIKSQVAKECTDAELALFLYQCQRTGLDALNRQIYAIKRDGKMTIQTSIDGYRLIAERSGKYEGPTPAQWCGADGVFKDVWLSDETPAAARIGIYRTGFRDAVWATALWAEYAPFFFKNGTRQLMPMWQKMGVHMLAKCAESLALRKAFPQELSGIYTNEEMHQADNQGAAEVVPAHTEAPALPAPVEASPEIQAGWKKLRASLNKTLQAAKSSADMATKRKAFEDYCKLAETIWTQRTYHNAEETFGMLYERHLERVKVDEELASPEGIQRWIDVVMKSDAKSLLIRVDEYKFQARLQTEECREAMHERALQLGFQSMDDFLGCETED